MPKFVRRSPISTDARGRIKPRNAELNRRHPHAQDLHLYVPIDYQSQTFGDSGTSGHDNIIELVQGQPAEYPSKRPKAWLASYEGRQSVIQVDNDASVRYQKLAFPLSRYSMAGLTEFTLSIWVNLITQGAADQGRFFASGAGTGGGGINLHPFSSSTNSIWMQLSGDYASASNYFETIQIWTCVTATMADGVATFYRDGVFFAEETTTFTSVVQETETYLHIGNRTNNARQMDGYLENARIWRRCLSAREVWDTYAFPYASLYPSYQVFIGTPGAAAEVVDTPTSGLVTLKGNAFDTQIAVKPELIAGNVLLKGNAFDTQIAVKPELTTGIVEARGHAFDTQIAVKPELTSGLVNLLGQPIEFGVEPIKSPATGVVTCKGEAFDTQIAVKAELTTGIVESKGEAFDVRVHVKPELTTGIVESKGEAFDTQIAVKPEFITGIVESKGHQPDTTKEVDVGLTIGIVQLYGWPIEAKPAEQAASSIHINAGGDGGDDLTDSASVIWLFDGPFLTSPQDERFSSNTASMSGIVSPLDQGDGVHRQLLADSRFDTSSTLNAGLPGLLEYSFSLEGNFIYDLRLWGHEVASSGNVTGGRVMSVAYDYGAGTTATFGTTFDLYGLAGAYKKAAAYEQRFVVTAEGAQTLRVTIQGGGGTDVNPLISALEVTSAGSAKVQIDDAMSGRLTYTGQQPDTQFGAVKKTPTTGAVECKGQPITMAIIHYAQVTTGVLTYKGQPVEVFAPHSPTQGVITHAGATPEVLRQRVFTPSIGSLIHLGGVPDVKIGSATVVTDTPVAGAMLHKGAAIVGEILGAWTPRDRDTETNWTEVKPDG